MYSQGKTLVKSILLSREHFPIWLCQIGDQHTFTKSDRGINRMSPESFHTKRVVFFHIYTIFSDLRVPIINLRMKSRPNNVVFLQPEITCFTKCVLFLEHCSFRQKKLNNNEYRNFMFICLHLLQICSEHCFIFHNENMNMSQTNIWI